ncbi:NADH:ubiquinone reductase (Na(+)-transporting) subunit F [Beijerinckia indica]|uniref:Oxidoreductase FAD/NAD(P)-binding domain protein n=1 Tax=Beijerinckia indica subsp. indica (strain ATCC 9039 / DSM 1715 / NCIMB 8712) TaxID=395963 RepID=B2IEL3_BEII9|nr:2Fe-2S iron-sulfur cluster binding domain-containing protein [Beijerinckia indica]ACB96953.1 oxidoreductase FAD/NAD(P)-binding domain protein [Beijerinckia indica subsp. indica ATCC 9039]
MVTKPDTSKPQHTVRLQPTGTEFGVYEGETILNAGFRQGVALIHGCKEGQCSACKAVLLDGDAEMLKYSTFALPDSERDSNHVLLCRTLAYSDLEIELLMFDEELLSHSIAVREFNAKVEQVDALTHDIRRLVLSLDKPMTFFAGQYADITLPDGSLTRSYSMGSAPSDPSKLEFIIKCYNGGRFSSRLDGELKVGAEVIVSGPYGTCFRREHREDKPLLLIGGGSGLAPLLSILNDQIAEAPERKIRLFYGARTQADLFWTERFEALAKQLPDFRFVPALSAADDDAQWSGERGFIHEVLQRSLQSEDLADGADAYACGPAPLIDAAIPVLQVAGVEPERIYFDKFTPATN